MTVLWRKPARTPRRELTHSLPLTVLPACCLPLSLRSQLGEGAGETEEIRDGGADRRESAAEMGGNGPPGAAVSEVRGQPGRVDSGSGGGGGRGGNREGVLAGKGDKESLKAERGRRILSTLDLVDTLVRCFITVVVVVVVVFVVGYC